MTIDQRFEQISTQINLITLKTSSHDDELNQLTKNLNELTLKVDVFASQLREGHQKLEASHVRLAGAVETLAGFMKEVAALQIGQDARIRRIESQPPPAGPAPPA